MAQGVRGRELLKRVPVLIQGILLSNLVEATRAKQLDLGTGI